MFLGTSGRDAKRFTMRDEVAAELQHEAGERVRVRVMRNADHLAYQQMLVDGLKGARVRNQNEILATLMQLRPEQLAQLIQSNDLDSFEELTHFGTERSRKILDSFRENVDPLALEITAFEDRIGIELNVATDRRQQAPHCLTIVVIMNLEEAREHLDLGLP